MIRGVLITAAFYGTTVGVMTLAFCLVRARDCIARARRNAQVRAARRQDTAEALELALMRREFDAIVAQLKADAS